MWATDLEWLFRCAASALGQRGTMAAVIAAIERGGVSGSGDLDEAMLNRIAYLGGRGASPVDRERRLSKRWAQLELVQTRILTVHYQPRDAGWALERYVGFCARAALLLAPDPAALLAACDKPSAKGALELRSAAKERAERGVRAAHQAWEATGAQESRAWADAES
jgi:hypothetical protein